MIRRFLLVLREIKHALVEIEKPFNLSDGQIIDLKDLADALEPLEVAHPTLLQLVNESIPPSESPLLLGQKQGKVLLHIATFNKDILYLLQFKCLDVVITHCLPR